MSYIRKISTGVIAFTAMTAIGIGKLGAAEKINFVLNWVPGGARSPVYWAKAQGWYSKAGIDLTIENGTGSGASAKKVGIGRNQVGIADLPTALRAIGKGADILLTPEGSLSGYTHEFDPAAGKISAWRWALAISKAMGAVTTRSASTPVTVPIWGSTPRP